MAEKIGFGASAPTTPSPSHHLVHSSIDGIRVDRYNVSVDIRGDDALDIAANMWDCNVELLTLVDMLRTRVLELERENSRLYALVKHQGKDQHTSEGDDSLICVLQAEIADLERQLHLAKAARKSAEATSEALDTKAKILSDVLASQASR